MANTAQLTAIITPPNAANQNVTWESSAPEIAAVDFAGYVYGMSPGTAVITAATVMGGYAASCAVTVAPSINYMAVMPDSLGLPPEAVYALTAVVIPSESSGVTWESSNTDCAAVDENGVVTAITDGISTITATSIYDVTKSASCELVVHI